MHSFDEEIGREDHLAISDLNECRVVSDAEPNPGRLIAQDLPDLCHPFVFGETA